MLELQEVSFIIRKDGEGVPLVDRVSICVPKGHFMAIVGPSGCGKTTLLKTIAGLNPESAGTLFWDSRNLSKEGDFSPSEIGYVPQFSIAYDPLTVDESVEAATRLRVRCRDTAELDQRIDRVLEECNRAAPHRPAVRWKSATTPQRHLSHRSVPGRGTDMAFERTLRSDRDDAFERVPLDAAQGLEFVGGGQPVGYWGVSMGTRFGVPFVAQEPRITSAIFGLFGAFPGLEDHKAAAEAITIPLMFVFQWEDELMTREQGLALFNAFGSSEKTMHINPGRHVEIPAHERDSWLAFWKRHLG